MIRETIERIRPVDEAAAETARRRLDSLTKPRGSLGRLEEMAVRLAAITASPMPELGRKAIFTFAADHGVAAEGVSAYPREVTRQMVMNFLRGGAAINALARHAGAEVVVVDIGVDYDFGDADGLVREKVVMGTGNMACGPAMAMHEAVRCVEAGIRLAEGFARGGAGVLGTGDMGIGNTTASSAIASVMTGRPAAEVTGRGTGISDETLGAKVRVIERAIEVNRPDPSDPLGVLAKVGGAEIGGIAGLCLGAAANRLPVVVDGFISTAGALIAAALAPEAAQYMFAAHLSKEKGHKAMLERLGLEPMLDLGMRLGEGTGAALAMTVLEAALRAYREMATFEEAGVSERQEANPHE
ncbi:MAG: nicotinate-nucleotide--dimethylbenzimidazole phosphoribosyltransferase [Thermodesulfovibrionales bacterium]